MAKTSIGLGWMGLITGVIWMGATACTGEFHSNTNRREMQCDNTGCWHCDDGLCSEYRCDETHQCPMKTVCSVDRRCLPGEDDHTPGGGGCTSHDDCRTGEICTLSGACVTSPGDPNRPDVSGGGDTTGPNDTAGGGDTSDDDTGTVGDADDGDVGPGGSDTTLPQHPDDVCLSNADCGFDGTCVNGGCFFGCRADGRCPPGQECTADGCRARTEAENACTFNGECGTNHVCRDGTCFRRCGETTECRSAERCSGGLCIADTLPVIQCSGAASCRSGESCVDGKCVSPCGSGNTCDSNNQTCDLGFCMPAPTCFDKADCGGADCVDGTCAN